jgi:hypothetical protein
VAGPPIGQLEFPLARGADHLAGDREHRRRRVFPAGGPPSPRPAPSRWRRRRRRPDAMRLIPRSGRRGRPDAAGQIGGDSPLDHVGPAAASRIGRTRPPHPTRDRPGGAPAAGGGAASGPRSGGGRPRPRGAEPGSPWRNWLWTPRPLWRSRPRKGGVDGRPRW